MNCSEVPAYDNKIRLKIIVKNRNQWIFFKLEIFSTRLEILYETKCNKMKIIINDIAISCDKIEWNLF
jgi:hypothetical protein